MVIYYIIARERPIMLKFLPIMLCSSAPKIYILCSKIMLKNKNCA